VRRRRLCCCCCCWRAFADVGHLCEDGCDVNRVERPARKKQYVMYNSILCNVRQADEIFRLHNDMVALDQRGAS
jgi:hypothetical protein